MTIRTKDGRANTSTVYVPKGAGISGIAWADVDAKYRALMAPVLLQTGQVEASLAVIHDFHRLTHVSALIDLLAAPAV